MKNVLSKTNSLHFVAGATVVFMLLNAFSPLNFSLQTETTEYPFKLTLKLEETTYKFGEPVNITTVLTNVGEENITLDPTFGFVVRDENFNHVYREGTRKTGDYNPYTFVPGQNLTARRTWWQDYDAYSENFDLRTPNKVPSGIYYVLGYAWITRMPFETPLIRITILEG